MMASRIVELASQLTSNVDQVNNHLKSHDLPQPSFDVNAPFELELDSPDVEKARISAIEATIELQDLLMGPTMLLRPIVCLL